MVKLLHIETATKVCSVALSCDGKLIDVLEETSENYIHAEKLTVFIEQICERNKIQLADLSAVVTTSGPGSFTGLRIGVSTAKGLCYALNIPLISVDTLDSIAEIAHEKYPESTICAMIDARRMEVFSTIYDNNLDILKVLSADVLTENSYSEFGSFIVVGDGAFKTKEIWKKRKFVYDDTILSSASGQVKVAYNKFLNKDFEDVAYFEPKYLKDFAVSRPKNNI